jgi:hypothetical protein
VSLLGLPQIGANPEPANRTSYSRAGAFHLRGVHAHARRIAYGTAVYVVSKILKHVERNIAAVYDRHSYGREKQTALLKWRKYCEPSARVHGSL